MNGIELIQHLTDEADIPLDWHPYVITGDDWIPKSLPYKESLNYWHAHIPMAEYNDEWYHYIDININMDTLNLNILHTFYNEEEEDYRFFKGALLYYDCLYNEGSAARTIEQLKEIKRTLVPGYFPIEYPEKLKSRRITAKCPEGWGWE